MLFASRNECTRTPLRCGFRGKGKTMREWYIVDSMRHVRVGFEALTAESLQLNAVCYLEVVDELRHTSYRDVDVFAVTDPSPFDEAEVALDALYAVLSRATERNALSDDAATTAYEAITAFVLTALR